MEFQSSEFRVSFLCQRFRKFMKINFMSEQVPDATTLLKFRHMIEENHLGEEFFKAINRVMEATGHIMHGGTIVDAKSAVRCIFDCSTKMSALACNPCYDNSAGLFNQRFPSNSPSVGK